MDELVAPGDVLDIVGLDGRRSRYLVMAETPRAGWMVEYQLLPDRERPASLMWLRFSVRRSHKPGPGGE